MRLDSRRRLRVEGLETRMLLASDVAAISEAYVEPSEQQDSPQSIVIGDVDDNGRFDTSDLVKVFQAGKYETNEPAGWSDGDWNDNRLFESGDLVLAFQSAHYLGGPVAAHAAHANAVRVSPGSDGLADAIAAAGPHGTVIVETGIHTESSSLVITDPVTIVGEEGAVIEFDSQVAVAIPRVIDAGFHIKNTRQVEIRSLEIRDRSDAGSTAILIEGSEHVSIEDNQITDFQFGVLAESADHSTIDGNHIEGLFPVTSFGVLVVNGFGNQVRGNKISGATFGIFVSGENGKVLSNTSSGNYVGIMLCNLPATIKLPDGDGGWRVSQSQIPATRWLVQGNTSTSIAAPGSVGYLVIDGANNNTLTNNQGGGSGDYDIELTALAFRFGLPEKLPASYDNVVNAGSHKDVTIKDCGDNNKVHGGDQVDTEVDACPGG